MLVGIISSCAGGSTVQAADCSGTFKTHILQFLAVTFCICDYLDKAELLKQKNKHTAD